MDLPVRGGLRYPSSAHPGRSRSHTRGNVGRWRVLDRGPLGLAACGPAFLSLPRHYLDLLGCGRGGGAVDGEAEMVKRGSPACTIAQQPKRARPASTVFLASCGEWI